MHNQGDVMKTAYKIMWDIGHASGVFPETYATEAEADRAAGVIDADNRVEGVWDEDCGCEVISVEIPEEDDEAVDEMAELRKAALSRGQP
jgi:DICT domain-containing protein